MEKPDTHSNPVNFAAILVNYLLQGTQPALDSVGRPTFAYGSKVHSGCPYLDTEQCLFDEGCKGPKCNNSCGTLKFNDNTSFPMQAGHPCIGCSQPGFWDNLAPFYSHRGTAVRQPHRPTYPPGLRPEDMPARQVDLLGRRLDAPLSRRNLLRGRGESAGGVRVGRDTRGAPTRRVGL